MTLKHVYPHTSLQVETNSLSGSGDTMLARKSHQPKIMLEQMVFTPKTGILNHEFTMTAVQSNYN